MTDWEIKYCKGRLVLAPQLDENHYLCNSCGKTIETDNVLWCVNSNVDLMIPYCSVRCEVVDQL